MNAAARKARNPWTGLPALAFALMLGPQAPAWAGVLVLEPAENSPAMRTSQQTLINEFTSDRANPPLTRLDWPRLPPDQRATRLSGEVDLVIAFGSGPASEVLNQAGSAPVLVLYARRAELARMAALAPKRVSGIYLDQPYRRILATARALSPSGPIGILLGAGSGPWLTAPLEEAAAQSGQTLNLRQLRPGDSPLRVFERLLSSSTSIVALPDPEVFNNQTQQNLLLNAYRHHVPVIGYSEQMVKAGALAAVYTDPVLLGRQAARLAKRLLAERGQVPALEFPEDYALAVNYQMARTLNLPQTNEDLLRQAIVRTESAQRKTP